MRHGRVSIDRVSNCLKLMWYIPRRSWILVEFDSIVFVTDFQRPGYSDLFSPRGSAMLYVQRLMRPVLLFTNVSCARCSALPCVQCAHPRTQHQPTPGRLSETQLGAKSRHQCVSIVKTSHTPCDTICSISIVYLFQLFTMS